MTAIEDLTSASFRQLPEEKREAIARAARAEFAARGFERASTNRIVLACGIAKGSLWNYFDGKEGLFLYLHALAGRAMLERLRAARGRIAAGGGPLDRLSRAVELSLELYEADPECYRFSLTLAEPDARHLIPRYASLFPPGDGEELFASLVAPEGSGTDPALARALRWMLVGIKFEMQARIGSGIGPAELRAELKSALASLSGLFKGVDA